VKTAVITLDGVLRKLMGSAPIPEGCRLYHALAATGSVVVLDDDIDHDRTDDWLELHGLVRHAFTDTSVFVPGTTVRTTRVDRVNALRRQGYDIDIVVDPDPVVVLQLVSAGFTTVLFTHAQYAHPAWRPDTDTGIRPWGDIVAATATLARMKAADTRLRDTE
jgi:hypothetical protein